MKKKFSRKKDDEVISEEAFTPSRKEVIPKIKKISKRDYFAGEALLSLLSRDGDCNFSVEAYYVADHMMLNTSDENWNPEIALKDYFASKFISGVIQTRLDKKYSPRDAFEVAEDMLEAREREFVK